MRIGIDVNGVLRDTIGKFTQIYEKHLVEKNDATLDSVDKTYELTFSGETDELVEMNESTNVNWFKYEILSDVTSLNLQNHFSFQSTDELYSFMYEEYTMELFGHAPSTETLTFNYLNDFYVNMRDEHEIVIISDEMGKSKPATLFFLSKFGCLAEKIKFYSNYTINSMWDEIDILLTANPSLLLEYPPNKKVIQFETSYNQNVNLDVKIKSLNELENKIKNLL
jgi:hypothetical protein